MKGFKKIVAIILCVATLISGLAIMCSAKETYDDTWVKLKVEGDEEIIFNVPYKKISGGLSYFHDTYMVQPNGKPIEECFVIPPETEEEWGFLYYVSREDYIGQCVYLEKDDCYYAQYKLNDADVKTVAKEYGPLRALEVAFILAPFFKIIHIQEFRTNPEYFLIAHDTWEYLK